MRKKNNKMFYSSFQIYCTKGKCIEGELKLAIACYCKLYAILVIANKDRSKWYCACTVANLANFNA